MGNEKKFVYLINCLGYSSATAGQDIQEMINGSCQVTRKTFLRHVHLGLVLEALGYVKHPSQGLTMAGDAHISYHKGTFAGIPAYYLTWSAIEYIFVPHNRVTEAYTHERSQDDFTGNAAARKGSIETRHGRGKRKL